MPRNLERPWQVGAKSETSAIIQSNVVCLLCCIIVNEIATYSLNEMHLKGQLLCDMNLLSEAFADNPLQRHISPPNAVSLFLDPITFLSQNFSPPEMNMYVESITSKVEFIFPENREHVYFLFCYILSTQDNFWFLGRSQ